MRFKAFKYFFYKEGCSKRSAALACFKLTANARDYPLLDHQAIVGLSCSRVVEPT